VFVCVCGGGGISTTRTLEGDRGGGGDAFCGSGVVLDDTTWSWDCGVEGRWIAHCLCVGRGGGGGYLLMDGGAQGLDLHQQGAGALHGDRNSGADAAGLGPVAEKQGAGVCHGGESTLVHPEHPHLRVRRFAWCVCLPLDSTVVPLWTARACFYTHCGRSKLDASLRVKLFPVPVVTGTTVVAVTCTRHIEFERVQIYAPLASSFGSRSSTEKQAMGRHAMRGFRLSVLASRVHLPMAFNNF